MRNDFKNTKLILIKIKLSVIVLNLFGKLNKSFNLSNKEKVFFSELIFENKEHSLKALNSLCKIISLFFPKKLP